MIKKIFILIVSIIISVIGMISFPFIFLKYDLENYWFEYKLLEGDKYAPNIGIGSKYSFGNMNLFIYFKDNNNINNALKCSLKIYHPDNNKILYNFKNIDYLNSCKNLGFKSLNLPDKEYIMEIEFYDENKIRKYKFLLKQKYEKNTESFWEVFMHAT